MKYIKKYATTAEYQADTIDEPYVVYVDDLRTIWYKTIGGDAKQGNLNRDFRFVNVDGLEVELTSLDLQNHWRNNYDVNNIEFHGFTPTSLYRTFNGCSNLYSLTGLDGSKCLNAREAFSGSMLPDVSINLPVATNIRSICQDMPNLYEAHVDAPNAEDCQYAFERYNAPATGLNSVYLNVEKNKSSLKQMFYNQNALYSIEIDGGLNDPNAGVGIDARQMFQGCSNLYSITGGMDCTWITAVTDMFGGCSNLSSISGDLFYNLGANFPVDSIYPTNFVLDLSGLSLYDPYVIPAIFNNIGSTSCPFAEIYLSLEQFNSLSAEDVAVATAKGWAVTHPSEPGYNDDRVEMTITLTEPMNCKILNNTTGFQAMKVDSNPIETPDTTYYLEEGDHLITFYIDPNGTFGSQTWYNVNSAPFTLEFKNNAGDYFDSGYRMFRGSSLAEWPTTFDMSGNITGGIAHLLYGTSALTGSVDITISPDATATNFSNLVYNSPNITSLSITNASPTGATVTYETMFNNTNLESIVIDNAEGASKIGAKNYGLQVPATCTEFVMPGIGPQLVDVTTSTLFNTIDFSAASDLATSYIDNFLRDLGTTSYDGLWVSAPTIILPAAQQGLVNQTYLDSAAAKNWTVTFQ